MDWSDNADVAAAIGAQLTASIGLLVVKGRDEDDLINGYLSGRYAFMVKHDGVVILEADKHLERLAEGL